MNQCKFIAIPLIFKTNLYVVVLLMRYALY
jgi:hypothetical protein